MAEQIAENVTVSRDPQVRIARLADHLQRFWDPRMRAALKSMVEAPSFDGSEIVRRAAGQLT